VASTFGSDVSTFPDLDPAFGEMTGPRVVGEAVARRLSTPRGALRYSPSYGYDLRDLLNESVTQASLVAWQSAIQAECEQDERVLQASAALSYDSSTMSLTITVGLLTADGPFKLVLLVTAATLSILDAR
jgi:hypothetical protein